MMELSKANDILKQIVAVRSRLMGIAKDREYEFEGGELEHMVKDASRMIADGWSTDDIVRYFSMMCETGADKVEGFDEVYCLAEMERVRLKYVKA